jgi:flagellar motor switch protein FliN/FliY
MKEGRINDVKVPVQVVLGGTELKLEDFASMGPGTIIELQSIAGEPVDLVAAGKRVAKGEVVVIDEYFGIRVTEVLKKG